MGSKGCSSYKGALTSISRSFQLADYGRASQIVFRSANNDEDSNSVPSGKNYVFDKRFSHAPGAIEAVDRTKKVLGADANMEAEKDCGEERILGTCESCSKPWVSMGRPPFTLIQALTTACIATGYVQRQAKMSDMRGSELDLPRLLRSRQSRYDQTGERN